MKILMVCLGNICRSPLAEGIMKSKAPENFFIDSAGTISMHEGKHPDQRAIQTASHHGIDISQQRSRPITQADFENFDKIYCMDVDVLQMLFPKHGMKINGKKFLYFWKCSAIIRMLKFRIRIGEI